MRLMAGANSVEEIKDKTNKEIEEMLSHVIGGDELYKQYLRKGRQNFFIDPALDLHQWVNFDFLKNPLDMNMATIILITYMVAIFVKIPYICKKKKDSPCNFKIILIDIFIDTLLFITIYYMDSCLTSDHGYKCQVLSSLMTLVFIGLICWKIYFVQHHKFISISLKDTLY